MTRHRLTRPHTGPIAPALLAVSLVFPLGCGPTGNASTTGTGAGSTTNGGGAAGSGGTKGSGGSISSMSSTSTSSTSSTSTSGGPCSGNQVLCPSGCADLQTDPNNCGSCEAACPGVPCMQGACACAHPLCDVGTALDPKCDPCVKQVCDHAASVCCTSAWDNFCVLSVTNICGMSCSGSSSSSSSSSSGGPCPSHPLCSTGAALDPLCNACVSSICGQDPVCCVMGFGGWDSTCVGLVTSICGLSCPGN